MADFWPPGRSGDVSREVSAPTLCLRRLRLQRLLSDTYGDGPLRLGAECTGFRQDGEGVTARFANGSEERGEDVLIGADGLSSPIRGQLHGVSKPRYAGYGVWFGTCADLVREPIWREIDGPAARFVYFPVDAERLYWACIANALEGEVAQARGVDMPGENEKLLARYGGWPEPVSQLIGGTEPAELFRRPIVDRAPLRRWGSGRVTLMGDAAHPLTINLGQGACQAIEDALVLTRSLTSNVDLDVGLREYEKKRVVRVASYMLRARLIGNVYRWKNPLACRVRDLAVTQLLPGPVFSQHRKDMAHEF